MNLQQERGPHLNLSEWLAHSGIQCLDRDSALFGGVYSWYDLTKKGAPFLYSEITGYAITAFSFLNQTHPSPIWKERAKIGFDWLMKNAFAPSGGVLCRLHLDGYEKNERYDFEGGRCFSFDTAMVGYGVEQLKKMDVEQKPLYEQYAALIERFLLNVVARSDGTYFPYYGERQGSCSEEFDKWSNQGGAFLTKLALFFIDRARNEKNRNCEIAARGLIDHAISIQQDDGRFVTNVADGSTHLHPHCYTLEGLIYGGFYLGKNAYLDAAQRGFLWIYEGMKGMKFVPAIFRNGVFAREERSDIIAQILRIGSILYGLGKIGDEASSFLNGLKDHLLSFQLRNSESAHLGGILFSKDAPANSHVNAWASMFAMQGLYYFERFVTQKEPVELGAFI